MSNQTKEEKVHAVFENVYKNYDAMNSIISFKQHVRWRKNMFRKMNIKPGATALDVCCGTADLTIAMAEHVGETGKVIGMDFSENMLSIGKEKVAKKNIANIQLVHGNAMELPFDDNYFDYVTIGFGLRNVPDYLTVLKEMHRVLKPGGLAVCLETSHPNIPGYKHLFNFYFQKIMPILGKFIAKGNEYSWLQESARDFPDAKELKQLFEQAGFSSVMYIMYSGGAAATHFGLK